MYKVYYPNGTIRKYKKLSEVVEEIIYYGAIGYEKVR